MLKSFSRGISTICCCVMALGVARVQQAHDIPADETKSAADIAIKIMILPNINILVHAHNTESALHAPARRWWDECLSGPEGIGLAWATLLGFIASSV